MSRQCMLGEACPVPETETLQGPVRDDGGSSNVKLSERILFCSLTAKKT